MIGEVGMVKNNVQKPAETDLYNAVVLTSVDIVGTLVKEHRADINEIPKLIDTLVSAFTKSAAVSGIALPLTASAATPVAAQEAEISTEAVRKRDLSGPAHEAMLARMAKARAARGKTVAASDEGSQSTAPEMVAEIAPESVEAPRRGRGRPRIVREEMPRPEPLEHSKKAKIQKALDKKFLRRNPPKCSIEESLMDTGDGKMTCLVDGKRVSFLDTYLQRNYAMTFADYSRIYDLPADYPTTPPKFKEGKKEDAKRLGLGTKQMRLAHKEKMEGLANSDVIEANEPEKTVETPTVVARPSGRARRTKIVDVAAVANVA
jgi:predicted transcriptional regulator